MIRFSLSPRRLLICCLNSLNFVGPTQISSCGHLTLDGSQSSGGGGRDLKYKWSLVNTTDSKITAELDKAENKSKVFINGTLMTGGSTYKFKLGGFDKVKALNLDVYIYLTYILLSLLKR